VIPGYAPLPDDRRSGANYVQRRRIALAVVVTVLAVIISVASRGDDTTESSTSPAGIVNDITQDSSSATPAFLPGSNVDKAPEIITVNVPTPPAGTVISGQASFVRWPQTLGLVPCATPHALLGARVTVTNLNNARTIVCDNVSIESLGGGNTIIIHTDVFLDLADLVDAPIPVEIQF
jgi:hypothetical protein